VEKVHKAQKVKEVHKVKAVNQVFGETVANQDLEVDQVRWD